MISFFFALLLAQEKTIVEGRVVNALTGEPLRKAQVVLEDGSTRYSVVSGSDGKFRFEGIAPGEYHPEAHRQNFLDSDNAQWFAIEQGGHVKDVAIKMTPQGLIAGHVFDEDSDPVPGLQVNASRTIHVNGRPVVLGTDGGFTDPEGYFLTAQLEAGRYYLSAEPSNHSRDVSQPGHPGREEDFVRTDDPMPLEVIAGAALRNVEIHIRRSSVYRIRGQVANPPTGPMGFRLVSPDGTLRANDPQSNLRDGSFEFAGVAPASYVLMCYSAGLYCHVPVTLVDHDVDLAVELTPGPTIEGSIKIEGGGAFPKPPVVQLFDKAVVAKEDGTFGWTNLAPRKYIVDYGPPDGCYVKSIQFNHQPLTGNTLELTFGAGGTLDIVVAPNAAILSATVERGKKAQVTLWSDSRAHYMNTDDNGVVNFDQLAPGEYRILAWQNVDEKFVEIPEFRARFEAQKVTLAEGEHQTVEVKLIPKSASDAEIAKLQ